MKGFAGVLLLILVFLGGGMPRPVSAANQEDIGSGQIYFGKGETAGLHLQSDLSVDVSGLIARVKLTQQFANDTGDWQEATYVLPLPETAAVNQMEIVVGDRVIKGHIKEKAEAKAIYQTAKREGKKAALMEQNRENLFRQKVANIPPGEQITVTVHFVQRVAYDTGEFSFRMPLTLTPRYSPTGVTDVDAITPPIVEAQDAPINPISIRVLLNVGLPIDSITSDFHDIRVSRAGELYSVDLATGPVAMDRDFELRWRPVVGQEPRAALFREQIDGDDYVLVMLLPPTSETTRLLPREMVFVIDTSGSMSGTSIVQAKQSLLQALTQLRTRDRFNIIEFDNSFRRLFTSAQTASAFNLNQARNWIEQMQAGGGTEMYSAMNAALAGEVTEGYLRQIVFMTDGAIGNEAALFELIHTKLGEARLFPIGIGSAPNSYFMRQAAKFGRGTFTHIGDLNSVREQVDDLFSKIESPVASEIQLTWPGTVESFPARIPAIYAGEPLLISAKASGLHGDLVISGKLPEKDWMETVSLDTRLVSEGVGTLWARAKIEALTDERIAGRPAAEVKQDILDVSLTHQVLSEFTSFVAVEEVISRRPAEILQESKVANVRPKGQVSAPFPRTATSAAMHFYAGLIAALLLILLCLPRLRRVPS